MRKRPPVLSIAGHDPSGGAGILADIKTFEQHKVHGYGVISALTWQNASEFENVEWIAAEKIISQIEILLRKERITFVKIGLIENTSTFERVVGYLQAVHPTIKIIWDPILKASAGFDFHSESEKAKWLDVLQHVYLITPNWDELKWLARMPGFEGAQELSKHCHVFLKGGHNPEKPGYDYLFLKQDQGIEVNSKRFDFRPISTDLFPKHGSGCVLSASLTALLARGYQPHRACLMAKQYVARFLQSNPTLLGYHQH